MALEPIMDTWAITSTGLVRKAQNSAADHAATQSAATELWARRRGNSLAIRLDGTGEAAALLSSLHSAAAVAADSDTPQVFTRTREAAQVYGAA
jgi:hypothetical protein